MHETVNLTAQGLHIYQVAMCGYFLAFLLYGIHAFTAGREWIGKAARGVLMLTWVVHTAFLVQRADLYYQQYDHFLLPATNMFEAIGYMAWMITLFYLIFEWRVFKTRRFGVFALLLPVGLVAYTGMGMDPDPRELLPSLKSYVLAFHVSAMFVSYSIFALAAVFALLYILRARGVRGIDRIDSRFNLKKLDETSARLTMFAFPVLTLGVFLGGVWADKAWGKFWGWDPKEVWALITWFVYLGYLHNRILLKTVGYRSSLLNVVGFASVIVTFQGVNLLNDVFGLNSIHSYANSSGSHGAEIFFMMIMAVAILIPLVMYFLPTPPEAEKAQSAFVESDNEEVTAAPHALRGSQAVEDLLKKAERQDGGTSHPSSAGGS
jgi:cytochrome c-type biogenesis protein CcsB